MQLNLGTQMRAELSQIISPRMIQSMEILTLPMMALQERIELELQDNAVLEVREPGQTEEGYPETPELGEGVEADSPAEPESSPDAPEQELVIDAKSGEEDFERMDALNEDWSDYFDEESRPSTNKVSEEMDKKHDAMANMAEREQSLQDYLNEQIPYLDATEINIDLLVFMISHLDERGYLITPLEDIRAAYGQDVTIEQIEETLDDLQRLDPPGVGARDYKECLYLQVALNTPHRDIVKALILNHLEDIQHNRMPLIQKKTGYDLRTIQEAIEILKRFNPKPGAKFATKNVQYITPDIILDKNDQNDFDIRLTDDWMPNIYINLKHFEMLKDKNLDAKSREWLQRKIQSAKWLIDAIEQRRATLTKVTKAIIDHQRAFLERGPDFIEPLKMQQIAETVGVHVTTVSRAVDDKWIQTPRGVFPLKRFFGGGTQTASGEDVAWETIKQRLLEIIGGEDKSNPLSDEDLVTKLSEVGYPVARRTVTKYRKALGIHSSRQRKVWG
ncbi:MAG: RNA polymerase sigma-54 factor [Gemmataceae bacterium]|nr:RNA polymerase sigma-54 factor [Gemmataceae bacterium]